MTAFRTRREALALAASAGLALSGCLGSDSGGDGDSAGGGSDADDGTAADWRTASLEDVTTGDSFTIDGFGRPVFLHTFAIWCSTCQRQHGEFATLADRAGDEFEPVELNVDPNEDPEAVRDHATEHGFDWTFAVSPEAVTEALVDEFGSRMTSPPQSPVILVCPDGETHVLDDSAVVAAADLQAAIDDHC